VRIALIFAKIIILNLFAYIVYPTLHSAGKTYREIFFFSSFPTNSLMIKVDF